MQGAHSIETKGVREALLFEKRERRFWKAPSRRASKESPLGQSSTTSPALSRLILLAFLWPAISLSQITVDADLSEHEWSSAFSCDDWVRTVPFSLDTPRYANQLKMVSTPVGLAVAFVLSHPKEELRVKPRTARDSEDFRGDFVSFQIDFEAEGRVAYEFSVSLGGGIRDGVIVNQTELNRDWDGVWEHAVQELDDRWTVEILIPWSTVGLQGTGSGQRSVAIYADRLLFDRNERYACPGLDRKHPSFLSEFRHVELDRFGSRQIDIVPYATWVNDLVGEDSTVKVGADVFWKPSGSFQLTAAINPDFGQVESDEIIVNLSAIESVFTDRRPFFTENQGMFDLRTPANGRMIYTRRIGSVSDDGKEENSAIDLATKLSGRAGKVVYGALGVSEQRYQDDIGRLFMATRVALPLDEFYIGYLATWVDRPFLDRVALVNSVDYEIRPSGRWRFSGQMIRSDIEQSAIDSHGYEWWMQSNFSQTDALTHTIKLLNVDSRFDMNDMGYMERNAFREAWWQTRWNRGNYPHDSWLAGTTNTFDAIYRANTYGDRLPGQFRYTRESQYKSGWQGKVVLNYKPAGVDDLMSRGNGLVQLDSQSFLHARYVVPRSGDWQHAFAVYVFQEGREDLGYEIELDHSWYPIEGLTLNINLYPHWSKDWLLWQVDNQFGSFEARRLDAYVRMDWLPSDRHELSVKLQWIGIDAVPRHSYRTDAAGRLVETQDALRPFTLNNVGIQFRYRYQIGPLSDVYAVYSRGGFLYSEDDNRGLGTLLSDVSGVRDVDQFVLKVRYRL